ncbi:uncharacterized protein LOC129570795 [Sitodiplosis mosellana]|uniref:uncharacterized protein LOC129570795 n=1 Tax=Sitodiplosis mosellana TaxID=263140 RepID=UPI002444DCC9|nr:uncharacterized protein LOC129570795 [Sitodiplosis mosellana]
MPFIWDDIVWKLIDEEDSYDKSRFVVVRKLHIKLNTGPFQVVPHTEFTADKIRRYLRKYGGIESIELLPNKEFEAHVTFHSDQSAYLVQLQHEFDREARKQQPFYIQPADTWEQPTENTNQTANSNDIKQTSDIFNLNEDCLLHLFKFLDVDSMVNLSEVCKLFQKLLNQHSFPRIREFKVYNFNDTFSMPLAKMRRTLRCIGPYITDLKYTCNIYNDLNRTSRFLETLAQYIGRNIRRAQFLSSLICEDNQILTIAPILRHLESLEIHDVNYDLGNDVDFEVLCPNLIELKLKVNMRLIKCCKPWARLQHLSVLNNEYLNTMTFLSFIEQNPRLTSLEFDVFDADIRLRTVADRLTMLQKLTMDSVDSSLGGWNFVHVNRLQHLSEINLLTLDYQHLRGITDCLATFGGLRKISLHAYRPEDEVEDGEMDYERSLIDLAKRLPHLEEFALRSVAIVENTLVDFIRFASRLQVLHIHWCHVEVSDAIILKVVNILKCNRPEQNHPLSMFLNPADLLDLHVTRSEDVRKYILLSAKCQHFGF